MRNPSLLGRFALILTILLSPLARSEVSLPNGDCRETVEEFRVQALGGSVRVTRDYVFDQWQLNARWAPLKFNLDALDGSIKSIDRNTVIFERRGDAWVFGNHTVIRKQTISRLTPGAGEGSAPSSLTSSTPASSQGGGLPLTSAPAYRGLDRNGQWIDYDQNGLIVAYGDKNDLRVWFEYGSGSEATQLKKVRDHFGRTLLTLTWVSERITQISDNPALSVGTGGGTAAPQRSVHYQWSDNKLTQVTDVLGHKTTYTYAGSRLQTATDPEHRTRTLTYGATGRLGSIKEADGAVTSYLYDYDKTKRQFYNRITHPATAAGAQIEEHWYNTDGKLIRRDVNGKTEMALTLDTANRSKTSIDAQNRSTITTLDEFDNIVKTDYPDGSSTSAKYSAAHGGLLEETDELGIKTTYTYDAKGNRTQSTEATGTPAQRITTNTYNAYGLLVSLTRQGGSISLPGGGTGSVNITIPDATTQFQYDPQGNITQITDGEGQLTQLAYNLMGQPVQVTDARSHLWKTTYNAQGRELTRTNPLNQTTTTAWNKVGERISETDADGNTTTYAYDAAGRLTGITNALGQTRKQTYDAAGRPTAQLNAAGQHTYDLTYDLDGRLSQSQDGNGNIIAYGYGDSGSGGSGSSGASLLPLSIQYPGFKRQLAYDARNRNTEIKDLLSDALAYSTKQAYDAKGNLTRLTDRNGKITTLTYDALGRLTQVTDPANGLTQYTYDHRDNLIAVTDANGNTTTYTYDKTNRRTAETRPLGQTQTYTYDESGNLITTQDAKGNTIHYTYDAAGHRTQDQHTPAGSSTPTRSITYTYNPVGSLTGYTDNNTTGAGTANAAIAHSATYTLDALQRKTQEVITLGANSYTTTTTWNVTGQKASITTPGGLKADYSYDAAQQLASVSLPTGTLSISDRQWTAPKKITFPGGSVQSRDYDGLLRPTRIKVNDPGQATLIDRQYTFDPESNITKKATEHGDYDYGYDDLYRLTTVDNPSGLPDEAWTYDPLGNRLTDQSKSGEWQYNANNQLTTSRTTSGDPVTHGYDENGSQVQTQTPDPASDPAHNQSYVYDAQNRLIEVQDKDGHTLASYQYDPFGRRIAKTAGGNTTTYLYSDEGLVAEATATGSIATEYGWQPGNLWGTDPLYIKTTKTGATEPDVFYYQNDHLGTPQVILDQAGNIVWSAKALSFGQTSVAAGSSITNHLRFPGQYEDQETKTHYNFFRDYDPGTGRYRESDPIGLRGGINSYAYAQGNPIRFVDSRGLDPMNMTMFGDFQPNYYPMPAPMAPGIGPYNPGQTYCGSGWNEGLVPDWLYGINISRPCYNHDVCYGECGKSKQQCDGQLQKDIETQCSQAPTTSIRMECYRMARQYRGAVAAFGQSAYDDAQKGCCQ